MELLIDILCVFVGIALLNVWILRFNKPTGYRGGDAKNMKEEFAIYGLPVWFCYLVGVLKIGIGIALVLSIWLPVVIQPAASVLAVLMLGAVAMHVKVRDPLKKTVPSLSLLAVSIFLAIAG